MVREDFDAKGIMAARDSLPLPPARAQCSRATRLAVAHLAMSFTVLAFSFWNVIGSVVLDAYCRGPGDDVNCPVVFACYREVGAAPVLLVICALSRGFVRPASCRDCAVLVGAGMSLFAIQLLSILGIAWTNADVAAFYGPASPVTVVVLAFLFRLERYRWSVASVLKIVGVLVSVSGIVLIVLDGEQKCRDLNSTACALVQANLTLCNSTITIARGGAGGGGGVDSVLVNASTECCRTCESASSRSELFAAGNVVLGVYILCCSMYTIFQKMLIDPNARGGASGGSGKGSITDGGGGGGGGDSGGGTDMVAVVGDAGSAVDDASATAADKKSLGDNNIRADGGSYGSATAAAASATTTTTTTTAPTPSPSPAASQSSYRTITIITYAYSIAAVCMATLTGILRPPAHLFAISGIEAAAVACVHSSCPFARIIDCLSFCLRGWSICAERQRGLRVVVLRVIRPPLRAFARARSTA